MLGLVTLSMLPPSAVILLASATDTAPSWLQYIQSGGVIGMFIVLGYALLSRKLVLGWVYDKMEKERDYYRGIAYKTTDIADRQVHTAEEMMKRMDNLTLRSEVLDAREEKRQQQSRDRQDD